jgi:hypothetical protein
MAELVHGDPIDYTAMAKDFSLKVEFLVALMARYAGAASSTSGDSARVIRFTRNRKV